MALLKWSEHSDGELFAASVMGDDGTPSYYRITRLDVPKALWCLRVDRETVPILGYHSSKEAAMDVAEKLELAVRNSLGEQQDSEPAKLTGPFKYWMVHAPDGGDPTRKHNSRESAEAEAKRLAGISPGRQFFVLEAVNVYAAEVSPVQTYCLLHPAKP